jgi:methyl-accepting chemotaxis protein
MAYTYVPDEKPSLGVLGDNGLLTAIGVSAVLSIILGGQFAQATDAFIGIGVLLCITGLGYTLARGSFTSRMVLTFALASFVTLHIHLAKGMLELHFGVFVTLALLLVYRDWRPIVFAAAVFSAYQIGVDRLQAHGWPLYSLEHPHFWRTMFHVAAIVTQAGAEIVLARNMAALAREGEELSQMVNQVNVGEHIQLDVRGVAAETEAGLTLKTTLHKMDQAVRTLHEGAARMFNACAEIAAGNRDLSERTEQTASNLQQTAVTMQGLNSTAQLADQRALQADELARSACDVAVNGGAVIAEVVDTMKGISDSSQRIAEIIGMMDDIAFQTNLLALNAAVEAARAGEQGRGFAVVASEVRTLAARSGSAAQDVRKLITDSADRVAHGASLMDRAGETMDAIQDAVRKVTDIMGELSASSRQQATEVAQLGGVMDRMDEATQQNAAMVEQMAAAATSLHSQADELVRAVAIFATPDEAAPSSGPPAPQHGDPTPDLPPLGGLAMA